MSDPISRTTTIQPAYPVKPVQPSQEDRRSGRRRNPAPERKPEANSDEDSDVDEKDKRSTIDEYI